MSSDLGNSINNDAKEAKDAAKSAVKAAKAAKKGVKNAKKAHDVFVTANAATGGALGFIAIGLLVVLLLVALVGGSSGSQMSNTYYLTMQGEDVMNEPKEEDEEAVTFSQGESTKLTEELAAILLEFKKESMTKTKEQIEKDVDKLSKNPPSGVDSIDKEKSIDEMDIPAEIANIDTMDLDGTELSNSDGNASSEEEKIAGEGIALYAKSFLGKGYTYGMGKKQFVCNTFVNHVLKHFGVDNYPQGRLPHDVNEIKNIKSFKKIYRYSPKDSKKIDNKKLKEAYNNMLPGDIVFVAPMASIGYRNTGEGKFVRPVGHVGLYLGNYEMIDASSRYGGIGKCSIKPNYKKSGMYPGVTKAVYAVYRATSAKVPKGEKGKAKKSAEKRWGDKLSETDKAKETSVSSKGGSTDASVEKLVKHATKRAKEGHPYKVGGWSWTNGIECHGFTGMVYKECGYKDIYKIIREGKCFYSNWNSDKYMGKNGKYKAAYNKNGLTTSQVQPGDIVYTSRSGSHHSAIYVGNGKVAQSNGSKTNIGNFKRSKNKFKYAFRPLAGDTSDPTTPTDGKLRGGKVPKTNKEKIWAFLRSKGYSEAAVSGIMGCIAIESAHTFDPSIEEYKSRYASSQSKLHGIGICQWTYKRHTRLKEYAKSKGQKWDSLELQLNFLMYEYKNFYQFMLADSFKKTNNMATALKTAMDFEQHGTYNFRNKAGVLYLRNPREKEQKKIYEEFTGKVFSVDFAEDNGNTFAITQGDMDILAAYSVSLGNLALSKQEVLEGFRTKWDSAKRIFYSNHINPVDKLRQIKKLRKEATEDEKRIIDLSAAIQSFLRTEYRNALNGTKIISATSRKKAEKKKAYYEGKWNAKKQKKFIKSKDFDFDSLFNETRDQSLIPYRDINGNKISVYTFSTKEHSSGAPDLKTDFKKKLKKWFKEEKKANFYKYTYKENGSSKSSGKIAGKIEGKHIFTYEDKKTITDEHDHKTTINAVRGYVKPVVREKKIHEIMKDIFKVDPKDKYVNATPNKKSLKLWKKYKKAKEKGEKTPELTNTVKTWITNKKAVKKISKETVELIYNGELPDASVDQEGDFITGDGEFICPLNVPYYCNAYGQFNAARSYESHPGLDMSCAAYTPIHATGDGVVTRASLFGGYGYCIDIKHSAGLISRYGHQPSTSAFKVKVGDKVKKGQQIGAVGDTGFSTGFHLHFEFRKNGSPVNPADYVKGLKHAIGTNTP